ncbi:nif11-like leader peptide domain protein [Synechococcus sp. BIOS-E4-1]|uniref:Nif11-like leader peptide family natural product precursor n=1 Tax=Synechococcus sp. BIOS-E4-1 TaxID=1400864 RepID=UPI0016469A9B|nr:Nif11-like leader peptide family natural product precursor [Synechococcus sp. BIOS-E4-1]QNI55217.1 nif11-like leader peptide domain protein [Synechococcus sp. BIOS-E4-1]
MSEEQLKAFLEKVKADTSLQEKLKAAADADAVVAITKEAGFSISVDDLKSSQSMSEEELEGMAGGAGYYMTGKTAECGPVACTCRGPCLTQ